MYQATFLKSWEYNDQKTDRYAVSVVLVFLLDASQGLNGVDIGKGELLLM